MSYPTWPGSLPQCPLAATNNEKPEDNTISTKIPAGEDKIRKRYTGVSTMFNVGFYFTSAEIDTFDSFYNNTLGGTLRFHWAHPRTQQPSLCRIRSVREVGAKDGEYFPVKFTLEVLLS